MNEWVERLAGIVQAMAETKRGAAVDRWGLVDKKGCKKQEASNRTQSFIPRWQTGQPQLEKMQQGCHCVKWQWGKFISLRIKASDH